MDHKKQIIRESTSISGPVILHARLVVPQDDADRERKFGSSFPRHEASWFLRNALKVTEKARTFNSIDSKLQFKRIGVLLQPLKKRRCSGALSKDELRLPVLKSE